MKNLEQGRVEQTSERSAEIERLRHENAELKSELEALKQMYSSPMGISSMPQFPVPTISSQHDRSYSVSPSITSTMESMSGGGSPQSDFIPMRNLSISSSMLPPSMNAFAEPLPMSSMHGQPYSMVPSSNIHHASKSSQGSSDYRSHQSSMGPSFQNMNLVPSSSSSRMHTPLPDLHDASPSPTSK